MGSKKKATAKAIPPVDDLEERFWGDCTRSYGEETKQRLYMKLMGFPETATWQSPVNYDFGGRSVIDIGGGPCSVLLKALNLKEGLTYRSFVVDPGVYPDWVEGRYSAAKIGFSMMRGEDIPMDDIDIGFYDLGLIYNCLQHTQDPEKVVATARAIAKKLCVFEWVNIPPHEGHPQMLTETKLNKWTGAVGKVVQLNGEFGCAGLAWVLG
jgi:hypothetical protein